MNYKVTPVIAALLAAGLIGTSSAQTPPPPAPRQSPPSDQPVQETQAPENQVINPEQQAGDGEPFDHLKT